MQRKLTRTVKVQVTSTWRIERSPTVSDYAHPESLASTTWLAEHLDDPSVRIVEVDWGMSNYRSGHIPGAVGWDWPSEVQNPVQRDLLDQSEFEALLSRSGITADSTVVVCSSLNNLLATYAFWLFKIYGHADVRLLDGDREKWLAEGRPTTTDAPVVSETTYHSQAPWAGTGRAKSKTHCGVTSSIRVSSKPFCRARGSHKTTRWWSTVA